MQTMFVYAIECSEHKYYVGKTTRTPDVRFIEHLNGSGSEWTKRYAPIKLLESYETTNSFEEDQLTKKYMMLHGIDSVRGGSYTKLVLEDWQIKTLEHEFVSMSDLCYKCGKSGHFANNCRSKYSVYLSKFTTIEEIESQIDIFEKLREKILTDRGIIQTFKYVNYSKRIDRINEIRQIEICPKNIKKYYAEIKNNQRATGFRQSVDEQPSDILIKHAEQITRNSYYGIGKSSNYIELLYKIYIRRVSLEKELELVIKESLNNLVQNISDINYDEVNELINDIIESLYEKYADLV
jgi:predicted GIY-YIG superfamily endonuclease